MDNHGILELSIVHIGKHSISMYAKIVIIVENKSH